MLLAFRADSLEVVRAISFRRTHFIFEANMHFRKTALRSCLFVVCLSLTAWLQTPPAVAQARNPLTVRPTDRVTARIDEGQRVTLAGHIHPLAKPQYAIGAAPQNQRMEHMVLVLRPDATQEAALEELLRAQQDSSSPYYHQWLTPEAFGERFGISSRDMEQVTNWLQMHGMEINEIPPARRSIIFSGNVGEVESAFHTSIQRYRVEGVTHYANATNPQIPRALAAVVNGPASLHDFLSAPMHVIAPAFTYGSAHYLSPHDWTTIYDVGPLYGQALDGTGQSVAVVGRVDINLSDVRTFRSSTGLPAKDPQIIVNGADPGVPDSGDQFESSLDVEWAGAIAKNATVKFVTSASGSSDGISLSAQYVVTHNVAPIVTVSYGLCEAALGTSGNAFWQNLWSQAAAEGISVFVSSGDSGAAGCDSSSAATASNGRGVNGLCSSVYSTCVGGTQFNDTSNPSQYWSTNNDSGMGSALSYIPELAWNESGSGSGLWSSGGGASIVYAKPSWQVAPGVPSDGMRDVPDVSMTAAVHDAYLVEMQGSLYCVGGTSASAPSLASLMALVVQNAGSAQGNVNPALYSLANLQLSSGGAAAFHDVTGGNNSVPGVTGFNSGRGYDQATGLGSVDATVLVNHWSDSSGSGFTLTPSSSSVSIAAGTSGTVTLTDTAQGGFNSPVTLSASGAPSGTTVKFSSATISTSAKVTVTITTAATTAAGNYTITVTGTAGVLTHKVTLTLVVPAPSFTLTASPTSATLASGNVAVALTTAVQNGFKAAVTLSATGLPKGVTAKFVPASVASPGSGSSTLTITVASGAATGPASLTITAAGEGVTKTQSFALTVVPPPTFTLSVSASSASVVPGSSTTVTFTTAGQNGLNAPVALSVSALPKGVTAKFAPSPIGAPGSGSSTLTLTAGSTATTGNFNLTVTASGGGATKTAPLALTVPLPPNFALSASATAASVIEGTSTQLTFTTAGQNRFSTAVALSVSGLPKGVTASFSPGSIASPGSGSSTLTLAAASNATAGKATVTITASGGGVTKTQAIALTVTAPPSLTVSQSVNSVSIVSGSSGKATFSSSALNGFKSVVALAVTGLPHGVTASFSPASIASPGTGSSTLTLTVASGTAAGNSSLTITASGGGLTKTQALALTIRSH